ncbi:MAG TPA: bifunctional enoyl-CoA hydratase/phosphate acetyltransferase [Thermoanaerobacterales bacterium]|jgi:phosphate butyryltransferase|nr:bifunctional enoyl-CoA hydratase/phosphate acetyltransferase [Thermoanaerobacterales bacterium]
MIKSIGSIISHVKSENKKTIAVAAAEDYDVVRIVSECNKMDLADFILVGDEEKIIKIAKENYIKLDCEIINIKENFLAAKKVVELTRQKKANVIMKGLLQSSQFLKAVLNKETGLNKGKLISQISVYDKINGEGLQLLTDCAISIQPTLEEKKQIVENAVEFARKIGITTPRVAILSALETVNPAISDTIDAAVLSKMAERGQIKNAIVDGPFALDNAICIEAAKHKNISGKVAGNADILLVPNLQVGNVLTKALVFFARRKVAAAVIGAAAPIVMTSRTDTIDNKILSIALALYTAD